MALVANVSEDDDASLEIGFNANNASDASKPQAWEKLSGCGEADRNLSVKYDSRWTRNGETPANPIQPVGEGS